MKGIEGISGMEKRAKLIARVLVATVFAFMLAGCAGQQSQQQEAPSANSGELPPPTQEELLKELEMLVSSDDFSSVTIEMQGVSSIGSDAAAQTNAALGEASSATSSSVSATSTDTQSAESGVDNASADSESSGSAASKGADAGIADDSESEDDEELEGDSEELDEEGVGDELDDSVDSEDESQSEDAQSGDSSSQGTTSSAGDEVLSVVAKCEQSNGTAKTQATIDVQNRTVELYINGDKATMVRGGQVTEGTLEKLGMTQYADRKSIIQSQAADISSFEDSVENIEVTKDDAKTVYKVTCNPESFAQSNAATTVFSKYNKSMKLDSAEVVYTVDSSRRLMAVETTVSGPEFSAKYVSKLTDYDTTKVADAPDPSSLSNEEGSEYDEYEDYSEYDDEYVEDDSASTSDSDSESEEEGSADSESADGETE